MVFCSTKKIEEAYKRGFEKGYNEALKDIEIGKNSGYYGGWCYSPKGKENEICHNGTVDLNRLYPPTMLIKSADEME